jgi:LPS export ABC transporter protein LptC
MPVNLKNHLGTILLIIVATGSYIFTQSFETESINKLSSNESIKNRFYLSSTKILNTAKSGLYLFTLEADYAEQESRDLIKFYNVTITYTPESNVSWSLTSDVASKFSENEFLFLEGDVTAKSGRSLVNQTIIYSDQLELNPSEYIVKTNKQVKIKLGNHNLTATGMLATLNKDKLELQSQINGTFLPSILL